MVDLIIALGNAFPSFWWAPIVCGLLLVIIAHIPNVKDFHWLDVILPTACFLIWLAVYLLVRFNFITH